VRKVASSSDDYAALGWVSEDGRRKGWDRSERQQRRIARLAARGFDYAIGPHGELIPYRRRPTHSLWWKRGKDDPNVKAARRARRVFLAKRAYRPSPTTPTHVRRIPAARPAARRPAARRTTATSSSSACGGGDDGPSDPGEGERRAFSAPTYERLRRLAPAADGRRLEEFAHRFRAFGDAIWLEVAEKADEELERYVRGELA